MDVTAEGGDIVNTRHMGFLVQDRLVQVSDAPALGNIKPEQLHQFFGGGSGNGVAPGPEGSKLVTIFVKDQIAVHHAGNPDGCNPAKRLAVFFKHIFP